MFNNFTPNTYFIFYDIDFKRIRKREKKTIATDNLTFQSSTNVDCRSLRV